MPRIRKTSQSSVAVYWRIALYIRLSREDWKDEDGKKNGQDSPDVSRSIVEQKKILNEYVETHFQEEDTVVDTYIDDGLTGTDDTRDNFRRMMDDVERGKVNCIIVKTLSRAFRNYADQGRYLEEIFPRKGVRFISTGNPFVDSFKDLDAIQNGLEIPINGLMNDRFAAKTSADVRRTFDAKRRRGEFIGAFAPYGYKKDPENKNRLLIDEEAAQVVKNIFLWFVNGGMSKTSIAKKLNELGIPNPTMYKSHVQRCKYKNPNIKKTDGLWSSSIVLNLLTNETYIGNMVQGRFRIISYKVHTQTRVPEDEWYVVPNTHEAIIDRDTFAKAQLLHSRDTRTAPGKRELYLFSGFLRCADCHKSMRRKTSKELVYYHCRTKTDKGQCTKHTIREDKLTQAVLDAIRTQIGLAESELFELVEQTSNIEKHPVCFTGMRQLREEELARIQAAANSLYLDWKNGDITKDDYRRMKASFDEKTANLREAIESVNSEINSTEETFSDDAYLTAFMKYKNIQTLDRGILVALVDTIHVHQGGQITIDFTFADESKRIANYVENGNLEAERGLTASRIIGSVVHKTAVSRERKEP